MTEVIRWLESPEGESWSRHNNYTWPMIHGRDSHRIPVVLVSLKDDYQEHIEDSDAWDPDNDPPSFIPVWIR